MSLMKIVDEENKMLFKSHCQRGQCYQKDEIIQGAFD